MESEKIIDLIQRDLDNDLSPAEKAELEAHLLTLPEDAKLAEQFRCLSDQLSGLPKVVPPVSVVDSILPTIDGDFDQTPEHENQVSPERTTVKVPWYRSWQAKIGGIAAAVLLIGLLVYPLIPEKFEPQPSMTNQAAKDNQGEAAPAESLTIAEEPEDTKDQSSASSTQAVWSPEKTYQAHLTGNRLIVRKASGEIQYQSKVFKEGELTGFSWKSNREIQLVFKGKNGEETGEKVTVDVEQKKIHK
ncbi:anti-sigma factor family protein [Paenactinomyces guangxiensis]|uniref:Zf-HC2 domain-containing protein n=1 Tax=Paenactinomyces guangxiensis TaxID=1490290 RepID=A0A7W1WNF3_9BACL|nr:zf-HC2 domain-containing protein [Paenactinomyces guangxiensis]MBA4493104.1 zf-HC2 domain-containing protein [Paenactinomyces guangxiensis]MBH8590046.1 zf-HC2 domain-containing protein [Paenactinomyces guangxiensis]